MNVPFNDLKAQYITIKEPFHGKLESILQNTDFILSQHVKDFEKKFAAFCHTDYCIGVNSGTDALLIALKALGIGSGDEVILPVNTFIATAEAICHAGATPVFVDILDDTKSINPEYVSKSISSRTKVVIPVHLYGNPAPMDLISEIVNKHKLFIIEDACQAHGAEYSGKKIGSFGNAAAFSFYPGKNLGAFGDGGAIVTNNKNIDRVSRMIRDHGSPQKYSHKYLGYTSRLDSIQAITVSLKLKHLNNWNDNRRKIATAYNKKLQDVNWLKIPRLTTNSVSSYHLYTVEVIDPEIKRDNLKNYLEKYGIGCGIHYPLPLHLTEAFAYLGYHKGDFPIAEKTMQNHLSLPIHNELSEDMIDYVVDMIKSFNPTQNHSCNC
jgi:dTDP-4-amino-4,6-dideoxygalactose transaminase